MRYAPLTRLLQAQTTREIRLTFAEVERALGRSLPPSARRHQAWWSNTFTHSHADAWMGIGWKTRDLDLGGERVVFERSEEADLAESAATFRRDEAMPPASAVEMSDPVTFDRAKLNIAARGILVDYTTRFGGDVQRALDVALEEARIAYVQRLIDRIPRSAPQPDSVVDMVREDRDAR
jgi:hypothetical protein